MHQRQPLAACPLKSLGGFTGRPSVSASVSTPWANSLSTSQNYKLTSQASATGAGWMERQRGALLLPSVFFPGSLSPLRINGSDSLLYSLPLATALVVAHSG